MYQDIPRNGRLVDVYLSYTQQLYNRIRQAVKGVDSVFMEDSEAKLDLTIPPLNDPGYLDRAMRSWTIKVTSQIQRNLDVLVDIFNGYALIDYTTGETIKYLELWSPRQLVLDETYYNKLNNNYKSANALLDRLFGYLKPYTK